jgi:tryptophan synthase alpha chain
MTDGGARIESAVRRAGAAGRPATAAFLTAGYPDRARFAASLRAVAGAADVVEVGVPFSDPVADGPTIQRTSREALAGGISLVAILEELREMRSLLEAPVVLMSYANPLLAYGVARFAADAASAGVAGLIVPDLPVEEQDLLAPELRAAAIGLVQLVAPTTPRERALRLAARSEGFVYAVAVTGTTGRSASDLASLLASIAAMKEVCATPVLAGFGIRTSRDVAAIVPPADGVVVGSALLEAIDAGVDPVAFLAELSR